MVKYISRKSTKLKPINVENSIKEIIYDRNKYSKQVLQKIGKKTLIEIIG